MGDVRHTSALLVAMLGDRLGDDHGYDLCRKLRSLEVSIFDGRLRHIAQRSQSITHVGACEMVSQTNMAGPVVQSTVPSGT